MLGNRIGGGGAGGVGGVWGGGPKGIVGGGDRDLVRRHLLAAPGGERS